MQRYRGADRLAHHSETYKLRRLDDYVIFEYYSSEASESSLETMY